MAYDQGLAQRIRNLLTDEEGLEEKEMFGGIAFMLAGNMACGVTDENLMARVGKDEYQSSLSERHVKPFDMTGRPMTGWVLVEPSGVQEDDQLEHWVKLGVATARSLPAK